MQRQRTLRMIILMLSVLLLIPSLGSAIWTNEGMLVLRNGLVDHTDSSSGTYSIYKTLNNDPYVYQRMQDLHHVLTLGGNSQSAQWTLGRLALAVGDTRAAADLLEPLIEEARYQPFVYQDILTALSYDEREGRLATLCGSPPPPQRTQLASDMIALACLEGLEVGTQINPEAMNRVKAWRPGDLYANYLLWRKAQQAGDTEAAAVHSEMLVHFPLQAVHPTDERLLDYAVEVIPALLEEGLWDRDKMLNVVSFLVWQHSGAGGVEQLLERLTEDYPAEPNWLFYLGELYHRRADWGRAKEVYLQVLRVDPTYMQVYLRLGMIAEAQFSDSGSPEQLVETAGWYEQYHEMVPDDLLGLKKVTEIYEALGKREAARLRREFEAKTEGQHIVAELSDMSVESVELGPNLVKNGSLETWEAVDPAEWRPGTYLGQSGDQGLYVAGKDALPPDREVARIITFWGGSMPDGTVTYAEYIGKAFPVTNAKYLVSVYYCAQRFTEGSGLLFLGDYIYADGLKLVHQPLPDSNGQWRAVHILVDGPSTPTSVLPLVRNLGVGDLYVGALTVRQVTYEH